MAESQGSESLGLAQAKVAWLDRCGRKASCGARDHGCEYAMWRGQWKVLRWSKTDGLWLGVGLEWMFFVQLLLLQFKENGALSWDYFTRIKSECKVMSERVCVSLWCSVWETWHVSIFLRFLNCDKNVYIHRFSLTYCHTPIFLFYF